MILIDIREIDGLRADRPGSTRSERAINGSSSVVVSRRLSSAKDGMIQVDDPLLFLGLNSTKCDAAIAFQ